MLATLLPNLLCALHGLLGSIGCCLLVHVIGCCLLVHVIHELTQ